MSTIVKTDGKSPKRVEKLWLHLHYSDRSVNKMPEAMFEEKAQSIDDSVLWRLALFLRLQ